MEMKSKDKLYSIYQVSEMLSISIDQIENYIKGKFVKCRKHRGGGWLLSEEEIEKINLLCTTRYNYVTDEELQTMIHGNS